MQSEVILSYTDESGRTRHVSAHAPRFTIGRSPDNDLTISNSNLSRRHAVVEFFNGSAHISDCDSQNGTTINGQPVIGSVELCDRDIVTLGGACDLTVSINAAGNLSDAMRSATNASASTYNANAERQAESSVNAQASRSMPLWLNPPVIAAVIIGAVIIVAGVFIALSLRQGEESLSVESNKQGSVTSNSDEVEVSTRNKTMIDEAATPSTPSNNADAQEAKLNIDEQPIVASASEQINRAVKRVMTRISTDNTPYISEAGIKDVADKVNDYRGSTVLAEKIRSAARGCGEITALAQGNNLKPALLMYAAMAQSESGGDLVSIARQMTPKLLTLRATFGTETANSSLLLVAAYPYPFNPLIGSQTRTAHPLASKLVEFGGKRSVEDTSVARSIWFLREKNGVTPEAYNLVVRLLAIGIIAQNPRQYGVEADPLLC